MDASKSECVSVGWTITINLLSFSLGFIANRYLGNHTANRKEDRELIDGISDIVAEIETKAYTYYSLPGNDVEAIKIAAEIRCLNSQIGRQVQIFSNLFPSTVRSGIVVRLKQAVTSNLDSSTRVAFSESSPVFDEISRQCRILIGDLNMQFSKKYR